MSLDAANAAFQRLAEALNRTRDPVALRAAVANEIHIDRHAPGPRGAPGEVGAAPVVESFSGIAEVEDWFARTPPVARFGLAGGARLDGETWRIEYTIDAGEFRNGGIWLARLACDGRIVFLSHRPFALRDEPPGSSHHHHG